MGGTIEVEVNSQGCIRIPAQVQDLLDLSPGTTLVVEKDKNGEICLRVQKETPELVEKGGILVVRAKAADDLEDVVSNERGKRLSELTQRAGL